MGDIPLDVFEADWQRQWLVERGVEIISEATGTEANRRNANKNTGPTTEEGKRRSRCNAVRHGLTAETVIGALEDAEDYKAFEAAIIG